jgi:hypothetical protein
MFSPTISAVLKVFGTKQYLGCHWNFSKYQSRKKICYFTELRIAKKKNCTNISVKGPFKNMAKEKRTPMK